MVSGAVHTTANTVRPALQIIKVQIRLTNWFITCKTK
jgi:phosphotransacetylase